MKTELLELLEFPRKLVHGQLDIENCPHDGFFDLHDQVCIDCPQGPECYWLCRNDEFASLENHGVDDLYKALDFAHSYIHAAIIKWDHRIEHCSCSVCHWYRQARSTLEKQPLQP